MARPELNQDAAVHFLCGCSFHYQCFQAAAAETRDKCPKCFTENQDIVSKINAAAEQLQNTSIHDSFHLQVRHKSNAWVIVTCYTYVQK